MFGKFRLIGRQLSIGFFLSFFKFKSFFYVNLPFFFQCWQPGEFKLTADEIEVLEVEHLPVPKGLPLSHVSFISMIFFSVTS